MEDAVMVEEIMWIVMKVNVHLEAFEGGVDSC